MLLSSGYRGAPVRRRSYDLLQGRRAGDSQRDLPASAVFSDSFSLKYPIC